VATLSALAVLAVVALVVGLILRNGAGQEPKAPTTATMPDLIGKSDAEAKSLLAQAQLTQVESAKDDSEDCDKGKVSAQDPAANQTVELTDPVSYKLCVGPALVVVPGDLVGGSRESAQSRLEGLKLVPNFVEVDGTAARGTVVKVEKQGEKVKPGEKITVNVSRGNQTGVPNVVGETEEAAEAILRNAGFQVRIVPGEETDNPGIVTDQNPKRDAKLKKNETVTITVTQPRTDPDPTDPVNPNPTGTTQPPGSGGGDGEGIGGILPG
jgi:serine/threonine-protein kinase